VKLTPPEAARLGALIEGAVWHWAKTYAKTAPHWYTRRREWGSAEDFEWFVQLIADKGREEQFFRTSFTYLHPGDEYKYWVMDSDPTKVEIINRAEVSNVPHSP